LHEAPLSRASLYAQVLRPEGAWTLEQFIEALSSRGFVAEQQSGKFSEIERSGLPALVFLAPNDRPAVLSRGHDGGLSLFDPASRGSEFRADPDPDLIDQMLAGTFVAVSPPLRVPTDQVNAPRGRFGHWFWGPLSTARSLYVQVGLAALLTNVFALATSIFTMIVYDRVLPNNAIDSLIALIAGIAIVFVSDFIIRSLRGYFLDVAGSRADMAIADALFDHVLDLEMRARRGSTGSLANVMKEFESVREFLTSATLTTVIDIPFALLFVAVIWAIGGPMVYVPLILIPAMLLVGVALQPSMRRLVQTGYEDGQTKHSVLVESIAGLETIKALGAGPVMRGRWQRAIAHQARVGLKTRFLAQFAGNFANFVSQVSQVAIVSMGVFLVAKGQIGMGAIIACSILAGRAIAPLAQLAQLLTRANQSYASYKALAKLMNEPREHQPSRQLMPRESLDGAIELRGVSFSYPQQQAGGLNGVSLKISAGERVAIVGRVGSGKTTLAKLLLGLYAPNAGAVLVGGADVRQLDPADLRRNIGAVMQEIWLMTGTVRQNIALGAHYPVDERIVEVAQLAGVHDFISAHPEGYNLRLGERGEGLSGGQRQAITIARALVGQPPILLLDEPTSAMDINAERQLIERLKPVIGTATLVVITHKATLLELVDRVIVLDQGKVVADGPRDKVLGAGGGSTSGGASAPAGPRGPSGPDGAPGRAGGDSPAAVTQPPKAAAPLSAGSALRGALSARPFGAQASGGGGLQVVVPSTPATGQPTGRSVTSETSAPGLSGPGPDSSSTKAG
jgi:ATP-binding cassette subfamily C protein LapB